MNMYSMQRLNVSSCKNEPKLIGNLTNLCDQGYIKISNDQSNAMYACSSSFKASIVAEILGKFLTTAIHRSELTK